MGFPVEPPAPSSEPITATDIERIIAARMDAAEAKHRAEIDQLVSRQRTLENQLQAAQRGMPVNTIPFHSAGPETEIVQVWSQWHQELARAGKLTDVILNDVRGLLPVVEVAEKVL